MDKSNSLSNPNNLDSDSNENFLNRLDVHTNFEHQKQKTEDMRHQQYSTQPYYKLKHYKIGKNNEIIVDKNEDILCIIDMKSNATLWDWLFSIFSALAGIYFIFFEAIIQFNILGFYFIILSYQIYDTKIKPKFPIETLYTLSQISEIFISAYYYTLKTFIGLIIPIVILYIIIKTNVYKRLEKFDILNNIIQENMTIIILIGVIMYLILIIYSFLPKYTINISEREHLRKHLIGRPKDSVEKINNIMTVDKINDTIKNYQSLY